jgi:hypothetical protein
MRIDRISQARRRKALTLDVKPTPYCRWNYATQRYDFGFTFRTPAGESYEVLGNQLEWIDVISDLENYFEEATA